MYKLATVKIASIVVLLCTYAALHAQNQCPFDEATYIKEYGVSDFGKVIFIDEIAEDANGCLVLATTNGLCIMDSERAKFVPTPKKSGVENIAIDKKQNKIYAAGDVEYGYYHATSNGFMQFENINDPTSTENISNIINVNNHTYYFAKNTIYSYTNNKIEKIKLEGIYSSFLCDTIPIIITQNARLNTFDGKFTHEIFNLKKLNIANPQSLHAIAIDSNTFCLAGNGILLKADLNKIRQSNTLSQNDFSPFSNIIEQLLSKQNIADIAYDSQKNTLAIATSTQIIITDNKGQKYHTIDKSDGLPAGNIRTLFFDSNHNLWAGVSTTLVKIELNTQTTYYNERKGLHGYINNLYLHNDKWYCNTYSDTYLSTKDTTTGRISFQKVKYHNSPVQNTCWGMLSIGDYLIACTSSGIYSVNDTNAYKILDIGKTYSAYITPTHPGKIFFATYKGLYVADYTTSGKDVAISNASIMHGIEMPVWYIQSDSKGRIWISTIFDGMFCITPKNKDFKTFSLVNIGKNVNMQSIRQTHFVIEKDTIYIYGAYPDILAIPDTSDIIASQVKIATDTTLLNYISKFDGVRTYNAGMHGNMLIYTDNRMCVYAYKENGIYNFDTLKFQESIHAINNVLQNDTTLYIATDIGLVRHQISCKTNNKNTLQNFNTLISDIILNGTTIYSGQRYFYNDSLHIYSNQDGTHSNLGTEVNSLKFTFASSCIEDRGTMTYSYLMEGLDNKWSVFSEENFHDFGMLQPGEYTLRVVAKSNSGTIGKEAIYKFKIYNPIYMRWWAIVIYIIVFVVTTSFAAIAFLRYKKDNARLKIELKRRQDEIIRQNERLKLLSLVASKNTNSVIILNSDGTFKWANNSFKNIYGYTLDEYIDIYGKNYFETPYKCMPGTEYMIAQAVNNKEAVSFENHHIAPNHNVYVQTHLDPVLDNNGNIANWIITETNITQLKLAEEEGIKQAEKLTEAYYEAKKAETKMEFQAKQLLIINERLENGYKKIKKQNITINQSLSYAQNIQHSIMPLNENISEYLDFFITYKPKDIVSGDFYMFEKISPNSFITIVADCTGHGVPGAFMSLIGYNIISLIITHEKIYDPKKILEYLSQQLIDMLKMDKKENADSIALSICKFDKKDKQFSVTFAGSRTSVYLLNYQDEKLTRFKGNRRQIGIDSSDTPQVPFENIIFYMNINDRLFQYSDGIIDLCNDKRIRYGTPRFEKFIVSNAKTPMQEMAEKLESDLSSFINGTPQRDDITVFGFNIKQKLWNS
jgi:PAS domain S-box-containing protein